MKCPVWRRKETTFSQKLQLFIKAETFGPKLLPFYLKLFVFFFQEFFYKVINIGFAIF